MDVQPGQNVRIEILGQPTSECGCQTLDRVCRKDPVIAKSIRDRKRMRPSWQTKQRGGRLWHHQMRSQSPVQLRAGKTYSVFATVDVLRDLASVAKFVKLTPA